MSKPRPAGSLGARNLRRIEATTGKHVSSAFAGAGEHFWALVTYTDGTQEMVNYKTGETNKEAMRAALPVAPPTPKPRRNE